MEQPPKQGRPHSFYPGGQWPAEQRTGLVERDSPGDGGNAYRPNSPNPNPDTAGSLSPTVRPFYGLKTTPVPASHRFDSGCRGAKPGLGEPGIPV